MALQPAADSAGEGEFTPQTPTSEEGQEDVGMGWEKGLLAEQCPQWAHRYSCHAQPSHPLCHQEEGNASPGLVVPQAPVPSLATAAEHTAAAIPVTSEAHPAPALGEEGQQERAAELRFHINAGDEY